MNWLAGFQPSRVFQLLTSLVASLEALKPMPCSRLASFASSMELIALLGKPRSGAAGEAHVVGMLMCQGRSTP